MYIDYINIEKDTAKVSLINSILKFSITWSTREGDYITNILHP